MIADTCRQCGDPIDNGLAHGAGLFDFCEWPAPIGPLEPADPQTGASLQPYEPEYLQCVDCGDDTEYRTDDEDCPDAAQCARCYEAEMQWFDVQRQRETRGGIR